MSMDPYSGDPLIIDLGTGGDLIFEGGQPRMSSGLENAVYLSLFASASWWGNQIDDTVSAGSTQFLALTDRAKLTPDLLRDAEAAVNADLAWMIEEGSAKSIEAVASIQGLGIMGLEITITEPNGTASVIRWKLNWDRIAQEVA